MPEAPEQLWHYTNAIGLIGILSSKRLWATHARFLNDAQELLYGLALISEVLDDMAKDRPDAEADALRQFRTDLAGDSEAMFFVACFCERDDLLSQWRAYSLNGGTLGYSIGFSADSLRQVKAASLVRVLYDPGEQREAVRALIQGALQESPFLTRSEGWWAVYWELLALLVRLKHPSFAEEKEWRIVWDIPAWKPGIGPHTLDLRFRAGRLFMVPYVEIELPTSEGIWREQVAQIETVRYGPTPNPVEAREALSLLLWRTGYARVSVLGSEAPLRV